MKALKTVSAVLVTSIIFFTFSFFMIIDPATLVSPGVSTAIVHAAIAAIAFAIGSVILLVSFQDATR